MRRRLNAARGILGSVTISAAIGLLGAAPVGHERPGTEPGGTWAARTVTFNKDIAPLIYTHCAVCHRPGGPGPFSLLTYPDVSTRARQIAAVTRARFMPPWLPDRSDAKFVGERRLSADEIRMLGEWVTQGALEGDASDLPPVPELSVGWQLGRPDLVIEMPEPYTLRPDGPDVFRNFVIPNPLPSGRYVRAVEFRAENPRVVHHARILIDRTRASRSLDERDPEPGYDGMLVDEAQFPDGHFLGWSPGRVPSRGPEDLAWRLDAGTDLVVQLHLVPTGKPENVRPAIGLFFAERAPTRTPVVLALGSKTIDIPAGKKDFVVEDTYVLPVDVEVLSLYPHAHYLATEMKGSAVLPDGTVRSLVHIKEWDFKWQDEYRFAKPVSLPADTVLSMRFSYDNSSANVRNPSDPPSRVVYGSRSADEMGELLLQLVPARRGDLSILQRDVERKEIDTDIAGYEKILHDNPGDYEKHNALGSWYSRIGRVDDALAHFERALRIEPDYASGHYNLGTFLSGQGKLTEAVRHFRRATEIEPGYAEAHNNLGVVLQNLGRSDEAVAHYRRALEIKPGYAHAHNNLGSVLASRGEPDEAVQHFRLALQARLDWVEPLTGLAWILATQPDLPGTEPQEAIRLAERAAELTQYRNAAVLDALAAAYAAMGQFDRAATIAQTALALPSLGRSDRLSVQIEQRLALYRQRRPYREPRGPASVRP